MLITLLIGLIFLLLGYFGWWRKLLQMANL
jgi:hypothetical protein